MPLMPLSKSEASAKQALDVAGWAARFGSSLHCVGCGAYVGFGHALRPMVAGCKPGSLVEATAPDVVTPAEVATWPAGFLVQ